VPLFLQLEKYYLLNQKEVHVINDLTIKNFRGVQDGKIEGLFPLTVLLGPNNSGKSTCLEALAFACDSDISPTLRIVFHQRGWLGLSSTKLLEYRQQADYAPTMHQDPKGRRPLPVPNVLVYATTAVDSARTALRTLDMLFEDLQK
jgi:ABC-type phosphate/phosphonate transport system ATPase subunit